MTNPAICDAASPSASTFELPLLANHKELLRLRVRPAEFARLLGVSKQCVSIWIREGKIGQPNQLDGRIDVQRSIQDVLRNTSPGRLRSRVLKQAVSDALELRENLARVEDRAEIAEAALRDAKASLDSLERWSADGDAHAYAFHALLIEQAETLRAAPPEAWAQTLTDLSNAAWDVVDVAAGLELNDIPDRMYGGQTPANRQRTGAFDEKQGGGEKPVPSQNPTTIRS